MASGNKKQIREIYKRIDGLATSLKRGAAKDSPITPEHEEAIAVLAAYVLALTWLQSPLDFSRRDIQTLNKDLEGIVEERKSRFKKFFSAKRNRAELQDVVTQLETARANYTVSKSAA